MSCRRFVVCSLIAVASICHAAEMSSNELVRNYTSTLAKQQQYAFKFTSKTVTTAQMLVSAFGKPAPTENPSQSL